MTSYFLCKLKKFKIVNKNEWVTRNRVSEDKQIWTQATKKYGMTKAKMNLIAESVRDSVANLIELQMLSDAEVTRFNGKLTVSELVMKFFSSFMEPEDLLLCSQESCHCSLTCTTSI
jgi:hypothetical protein